MSLTQQNLGPIHPDKPQVDQYTPYDMKTWAWYVLQDDTPEAVAAAKKSLDDLALDVPAMLGRIIPAYKIPPALPWEGVAPGDVFQVDVEHAQPGQQPHYEDKQVLQTNVKHIEMLTMTYADLDAPTDGLGQAVTGLNLKVERKRLIPGVDFFLGEVLAPSVTLSLTPGGSLVKVKAILS